MLYLKVFVSIVNFWEDISRHIKFKINTMKIVLDLRNFKNSKHNIILYYFACCFILIRFYVSNLF